MTNKMISLMKPWWVLALVLALALSLTSCSNKKKDRPLNSGIGYTQCDGTMGRFDVYIREAPGNSYLFELIILPYTVANPGDVASITIANQSNAYKELVNQVVLDPDQTIFGGYLINTDLDNYNVLAISSFDASDTRPFPFKTPEKASYCSLPIPGSGGALR